MKDTIQELVIISGKGGTGKTSVAASLAALAERPVIADCDVDAADLHLVLAPAVRERHAFHSGREAVIRAADCTQCGKCEKLCRFGGIQRGPSGFEVDPVSCEGCGVCVRFCPESAIDFPERLCGEWMVSETRFGPLVHARLGAAAENSGKLVSVVRREARRIAEEGNHPYIIVDGSPGIGCPVIASLTGANLVLAVTEPTPCGLHDLQRVVDLTRHFNITTLLCINKWDINPAVTDDIIQYAYEQELPVVGRLSYTPEVTKAQIEGQAVVEYTSNGVTREIKQLWKNMARLLTGNGQA